MRLGIIGVGGMGGAMARSVLRAGRPLAVHDTDEAKVRDFAARGAAAASSPAELAEMVDVVCVVVANDAQVRAVVVGGSDTVWVIHSTVSPGTVIEMSERATVLDAPVTGGEIGAETGQLALMVGGDAAVLERVRSVFEPYASLIEHLGGLGAGQRTKLARNIMTYVELVMAREVRDLVDAAGIDADAFRRVVAHSDRTIPAHGGILLPESWLRGSLPAIPHKDLRAAIALADELGVGVPSARLADQLIDEVLRIDRP